MFKSDALVVGALKKQGALRLLVYRICDMTDGNKSQLFLEEHPSFLSKLERLFCRADRRGTSFRFEGKELPNLEEAKKLLAILFEGPGETVFETLRHLEIEVDGANHRLKHPDGCRWCRHCKPKP